MKYEINWDSNNKNGVIINDRYPTGALFSGEDKKPKLSIYYDWFQYYENSDTYLISIDGILTEMSDDLRAEIQLLAKNWIQAEGDEGNPTLEQIKDGYYNQIIYAINDVISFEYEIKKGIKVLIDNHLIEHLRDIASSGKQGKVITVDGKTKNISSSIAADAIIDIAIERVKIRDKYYEVASKILQASSTDEINAILENAENELSS